MRLLPPYNPRYWAEWMSNPATYVWAEEKTGAEVGAFYDDRGRPVSLFLIADDLAGPDA